MLKLPRNSKPVSSWCHWTSTKVLLKNRSEQQQWFYVCTTLITYVEQCNSL